MIYEYPKIMAVSDSAFSVELGDEICEALCDAVTAFSAQLEAEKLLGMVEYVPSYRSVMVEYDPCAVGWGEVKQALAALAGRIEPGQKAERRTVRIPVLYGGEMGPDLIDLGEFTGLSPEEVVDLHTKGRYLVYMLGFTPGYPYLGGLDKRLHAPRLKTPRTKIPRGSVAIGGEQTGIYSVESPGGWRIIGRTPLKLFDKGRAEPFLLHAGDMVEFYSIDHETFSALGGEADA